jgi:hypothetical protein
VGAIAAGKKGSDCYLLFVEIIRPLLEVVVPALMKPSYCSTYFLSQIYAFFAFTAL